MRQRIVVGSVLLAGLLFSPTARARNFEIRGDNELGGGLGFAGPITDWTPGGFKWFNDYSRRLSQLTWLNVQLNFVLGGSGWDEDCYYDRHGNYVCDHGHYDWGGYTVEAAIGVKLKWRLHNIPLQFHAKVGGAFDLIVFEGPWGYDYDYTGFAIGVRGGFGVRYFFVPTFGVGAELVPTFGPAFINHDVGAEFYAAIDFNTGIEWRF